MTLFIAHIPLILYGLATLATLLLGIVYAKRRQVMPYHLEAMETRWEDIAPKQQFMLKAILNGAGYFGVATGLAMLILILIPFRQGADWAGYAIGAIGLTGAVPLAHIVYTVKTKTAGNPPVTLMVVILALLVGGLVSHALL